jgi:hypothetical protein
MFEIVDYVVDGISLLTNKFNPPKRVPTVKPAEKPAKNT